MLETIGQRLPVTVRLTVVAVVFETLFGVTAGILASLRRNSFFDNLVSGLHDDVGIDPGVRAGLSWPSTCSVQAGLVPDRRDRRRLVSYLLPGWSWLAVDGVCGAADPIGHAGVAVGGLHPHRRPGGVGRTRIILRHAFRNSLIPVVTFIGADIGSLLGGAIVTESVFNLPGLGRAIFDAVRAQQGPVVVGIVTLMVFFASSSTWSPTCCTVIDPRIRYD